MEWSKILYVIGALLLVWLLYSIVKKNPGSFSGKNFSKSLRTLGFLAIGLIAFVSILVLITRQ